MTQQAQLGIAEDIRRAEDTERDPFAPESEARLCELVMGDRRHGLHITQEPDQVRR